MLEYLALQRLHTPPCFMCSLAWLYLWISSLANWLKLLRHCRHLKEEEEEEGDFSKVWWSLLCLSSLLGEEAWMSQMSHLSRPLSCPTLVLSDEFLPFCSDSILAPVKSKIIQSWNVLIFHFSWPNFLGLLLDDPILKTEAWLSCFLGLGLFLSMWRARRDYCHVYTLVSNFFEKWLRYLCSDLSSNVNILDEGLAGIFCPVIARIFPDWAQRPRCREYRDIVPDWNYSVQTPEWPL